jgi:hypothetical protein
MSATLIVVDDLRNDNATESCLYHDALVCVCGIFVQWYLFWSSLHPHSPSKVRRGPFHRGNIKSQGPFAHTILADQHELRSSCIGPCWLDWTSHRRYHGLWETHTPYTQLHPQSEERREGDVRCTLVKLQMMTLGRLHCVCSLLQVNTPYRIGVCSALSSIIFACSLGIRFWTGIGSC